MKQASRLRTGDLLNGAGARHELGPVTVEPKRRSCLCARKQLDADADPVAHRGKEWIADEFQLDSGRHREPDRIGHSEFDRQALTRSHSGEQANIAPDRGRTVYIGSDLGPGPPSTGRDAHSHGHRTSPANGHLGHRDVLGSG